MIMIRLLFWAAFLLFGESVVELFVLSGPGGGGVFWLGGWGGWRMGAEARGLVRRGSWGRLYSGTAGMYARDRFYYTVDVQCVGPKRAELIPDVKRGMGDVVELSASCGMPGVHGVSADVVRGLLAQEQAELRTWCGCTT